MTGRLGVATLKQNSVQAGGALGLGVDELCVLDEVDDVCPLVTCDAIVDVEKVVGVGEEVALLLRLGLVVEDGDSVAGVEMLLSGPIVDEVEEA